VSADGEIGDVTMDAGAGAVLSTGDSCSAGKGCTTGVVTRGPIGIAEVAIVGEGAAIAGVAAVPTGVDTAELTTTLLVIG
jgi:hypothetical protein